MLSFCWIHKYPSPTFASNNKKLLRSFKRSSCSDGNIVRFNPSQIASELQYENTLGFGVESKPGKGRLYLRRLVAGFPPRRPGFDPTSGYVEFEVDKVALEQISPEYFGFPCQFSFHRTPHTHLLSGDGTIGQLVADVPTGLSLTPPHEIKTSTHY
jgi:hypothetical protein